MQVLQSSMHIWQKKLSLSVTPITLYFILYLKKIKKKKEKRNQAS